MKQITFTLPGSSDIETIYYDDFIPSMFMTKLLKEHKGITLISAGGCYLNDNTGVIKPLGHCGIPHSCTTPTVVKDNYATTWVSPLFTSDLVYIDLGEWNFFITASVASSMFPHAKQLPFTRDKWEQNSAQVYHADELKNIISRVRGQIVYTRENLGDPSLFSVYVSAPSSTAVMMTHVTADSLHNANSIYVICEVLTIMAWADEATVQIVHDLVCEVTRPNSDKDILLTIQYCVQIYMQSTTPGDKVGHIRKLIAAADDIPQNIDKLQIKRGGEFTPSESNPDMEKVLLYHLLSNLRRSQAKGVPAPRGYLLHWPSLTGKPVPLWHENSVAGELINCGVEPLYSYGVNPKKQSAA